MSRNQNKSSEKKNKSYEKNEVCSRNPKIITVNYQIREIAVLVLG